MDHSEEDRTMRLRVIEVSGGYWMVEDRFHKQFGDGLLLSKKGAELLLKAMDYARKIGYESAQQEMRKVLGLKW